MLLAQQGATLHALSHLYYGGRALAAQVRQSGGLIDDDHCQACQAFSQVAHPAAGSTVYPAAPRSAILQSPPPSWSFLSAAAPLPRSRGPPQARA